MKAETRSVPAGCRKGLERPAPDFWKQWGKAAIFGNKPKAERFWVLGKGREARPLKKDAAGHKKVDCPFVAKGQSELKP